MDQLSMDLRYALRTLRKNPAFATVAILVLALGIGASTAIFSVVNAVLIRPVPYRDPAQLIAISALDQRNGAHRLFPRVSLDQVEHLRAASRSLESIGSFVFSALPVNVGTRAMYVVAIGADPELLDTLGIQPAIGRNLPGSGSTLKDPSVVISHRLWVDAFQSDPNVIGRTLSMNGDVSTVAGVLPASFQFPRPDTAFSADDPDIIYPVANIADMWGRGSTQWIAIGRLKPGVSIETAAAELRTIASGMAAADPALRGLTLEVGPLGAETAGSVRSALLITLGISIVLLLIACANIMNLLFSRAAERGREMAVRQAVGATTGRLIRQMLTESAVLTFSAGILGVVLARFVLDALLSLWPAHLPVSGRVEIDWMVLRFAFIVCAGAALLAGVLPAVRRAGPIATTRTSAGRGLLRFQRGLMVAQIALGVALLAAAGILTHSLYRLSSVAPGFRTQGTIGFELAFPSGRPKDAPARYEHILDAVRGIPGVVSAGWITNLPPETRAGVFMPCSIPGDSASRRAVCNTQVTSEDYFDTAGIRLARGRDFTRADSATAPKVAVVNEALARRFFPDGNALGKRIAATFDGQVRDIVGVIPDIHDRGLSANPVPTVYLPYRQFALAYGGVVVRIAAPPSAIIPEIRRRVASVDSTIPLTNFSTLDARLHRTLDTPRFYTIMAAACALMAVLFVTLGLYGVISYAVSRRTSEIGIRMALGARSDMILRATLWQGVRLAVFGVAVGLAISLAATRLLATLLFEIKPADPPALAAAAAIVFTVTLAASYLPARRASRVHPLVALRHE
jgi:putative ABC transport system permease protein